MTVNDDRVLDEVREMGPTTASQIASAIDMPERSVRRCLRRLEGEGLIESDDSVTRGVVGRVFMVKGDRPAE